MVGIEWVAALLQYRDFARGVHQRQFVGESFLLSDRDDAILFFLCFVDYLHGLPERYMPLIPLPEDAVQQSRHSQEADMAGF